MEKFKITQKKQQVVSNTSNNDETENVPQMNDRIVIIVYFSLLVRSTISNDFHNSFFRRTTEQIFDWRA